jgi:hypothetical protein
VPALVQRSGWGARSGGERGPTGVAGSGPFANAVAISVSRSTIVTVSGSVAAVPRHEAREIRRHLPERFDMAV